MTMAGRFDREPSHEKKIRLFREFVVEKAMINLSQETEALAQRVALAKRVGVDDAFAARLKIRRRPRALPLSLAGRCDQSAEAVAARHARIDEIVREVAALPVLDPRPTQALIDDLNEL